MRFICLDGVETRNRLLKDSINMFSTDAGERAIGHQHQALSCTIIDDRQDAEAVFVRELIGDEVERPAFVRIGWDCHGRWRTSGNGNRGDERRTKRHVARMPHCSAIAP